MMHPLESASSHFSHHQDLCHDFEEKTISSQEYQEPAVIRGEHILGIPGREDDVIQDAGCRCDCSFVFLEKGSSPQRRQERSRSLVGSQEKTEKGEEDCKVSSSSKSSSVERSVAKEGSLQTPFPLFAKITSSSRETRDVDTTVTPDDDRIESDAIAAELTSCSRSTSLTGKTHKTSLEETSGCMKRLHCCSSCPYSESFFMKDVSRDLTLIMKRLEEMNHRLEKIEGRLLTPTQTQRKLETQE
jgi:hypothetical protein